MWLHVEKILESRGGHQETSLDIVAGGQTGELGPRGAAEMERREGGGDESRRTAWTGGCGSWQRHVQIGKMEEQDWERESRVSP